VDRLTFPKKERLCGRERVSFVATQGRSVTIPPFRLIGKKMVLPTDLKAQVAFAVPRRNLRQAVDRNRTKRRMREAYRLGRGKVLAELGDRADQYGWLFVFQGKRVPAWAEAQQKITQCLVRWMKEHG
jgi:ribonuclease P protein component